MGQLSVTVVTSFILVLTYYLVMFSVLVSAAPTNANGGERADDASTQPETNRNVARLFKPMVYAYNFNRNIRTPFSSSISQRLASAGQHKIQPLELDLLVDDDDFIDKSKRYDDYGHMRFGKRGDDKFDDYGHMRFGKRGE
ncbi:drosulfakinins [Sitodiplosis mosellana]|uniref:drosulfakinins n=1 Tax=Sitodiplosis mosellana TaxID=263140 RepID=UPI00244451CF|nr:drosulfakinins [Sitodiplosis mosellana]